MSAFGTPFGVRTNRPDLWPQLETHLPLGSKIHSKPLPASTFSLYAGGGRRRDHQLYLGAALVARSSRLTEVLERFESQARLTVAATSPLRVFVHAGAVAVSGVGVVLPGRSFYGKSTLVAALLKAGATYYSDEFAVLDRMGRLHPYAIPVSLRTSGAHHAQRISPISLGAQVGRQPVAVGLVLETAYMPDGRWQPERLSSGQAALALLRDTVTARRQPARSMATVRRLVERATAFKSVRGHAEEVASWIFDYLVRKEAALEPARTPSRFNRRVARG